LIFDLTYYVPKSVIKPSFTVTVFPLLSTKLPVTPAEPSLDLKLSA